MKKWGLLWVLIILAFVTSACSAKYSEADVQRIESDIRAQFQQKGFVVEEVSMIKDSDRHMTGFAKVHKPGVVLSKLEVTKNCTATMDTDSGRSLWECK